jgi:8-oxo-dGTP diphosphatase
MKEKNDFYQVSLKIILKNKKNEVLLLGSLPTGSFAGYYDLPGGRIDTDEFTTPFSGVIKREVNEEIGNVKFTLNPKPVGVGRHLLPAAHSATGSEIHILYLFFEAKYLKGEIKISPEHTGFKWVDLSKEKLSKLFKSGTLEGMKMYFSSKIQN